MAASQEYRWLPFRFERAGKDEVVVTNLAGEWQLLKDSEFEQLRTLTFSDLDLRERLVSKHLVFTGKPDTALRLLTLKSATRFRRIPDLTGLHIFVVTLRCEHACEYCQVSRQNSSSTEFDMSIEDAMKALNIVFESPSPQLKIEFQGGESLLNFDLIRHIVIRAKELNDVHKRDLSFVIATNLVPLTEEVLDFAIEHEIYFSTSLDGPSDLHNANRARPGRDSYEKALIGINRVRARLGNDAVSALMTTTERSLSRPEEIIDEYVRLGFSEIFLRFLSPYGLAVRTRAVEKYRGRQWLSFYERGLRYIVDLNRSGHEIAEVLASIYLKKMLTNDSGGYVDLSTPTGAGLSTMVYNYDGDVYCSDEGRMLREMGDTSFRLGSVRTHSYLDLLLSDKLLDAVEASLTTTSPMCSECAYEQYCGSDPVVHHTTQGDMTGFKPLSEFCERTMTIVPMLMRMYQSDRYCRDLFTRWATR